MAKGGPKSAIAIQRLLDERQQIQQWLERLDMTADAAPEQVRSRVRQDYERRLQEVMSELESHGEELAGTLERQHGVRAGLERQEREAAERLAEAELRHAVGEYTEAQWRQTHAELVGALVKVREELKRADEEMARLEDVVALLESEPSSDQAPAPPPPAAARAAERSRKVGAPPREPQSTKDRRAPQKPAAEPQTEAFDELAFLRSVTEDENQGPSPTRASGAMKALTDEPKGAGRAEEEPAAPEYRDPEQRKDAVPRTSKAIKSLKCVECGMLNLPTEWYCERCGAELAAV